MNIKLYLQKKLRSFVQLMMYVGVRFATGIQTKSIDEFSSQFPKVFFVNHNSHLDFILMWASIPLELRKNLHPVAAKDYWDKSKLRLFISKYIFDAVLVERNSK
ncbi:MAG: 1-acyl-sn-glycerol-3-phosphate acyltransferase, partial [Neisseriaceae bacterium]|nr:1-acyl-sn-glycerol-3-phosphate acyltransferase [Neisseriaceae bacterium]